MLIADLRLAELLCTRLSHDLTGPIGAVSNGVELLGDKEFGMQDQAVDLIVSSAGEAVARLQFYRMAYGRVKDSGEVDLFKRRSIAQQFFANSKLKLDWPDHFTGGADISISVNMSRLLFNMLIIASATLIRGGNLSVRMDESAEGRRVSVAGAGSSIRWDEELIPAIDGSISIEALDPKTIQAYLTYRIAEELGVLLSCVVSADAFEIIALQKNTVT